MIRPMMWKAGASILSRISPEPYRSAFRALNEALALRLDHPLIKIGSRIVSELDPHVRKTFFRNVVRGWLLDGRRIRSGLSIPFPPLVLISVTDSCNYRCKGCYAAGHAKGHEMSPDTVDRLIGEAESHGTNHFVLLGGEPFMWTHIVSTLELHPNSWFQIYTNGSRISSSVARDLRKAGNAQIMLSLEGLREYTDARRGDRAFLNCTTAMENLRRERLPFGVGITCYHSNVRHVISDEFVEDMVRRGCLFLWYFRYMPYGDAPDFGEVLTHEDRALLCEGVVRIRNTYPVIAADQIADCAPIGGCSVRAGLTLHITSAGVVEPCAQMHFSDCSIEGRSLRQVIEESEFLRLLRSPAADPTRACYLLDNCADLREAVGFCGADDNTAGRDTETLAQMAERLSLTPHSTLDTLHSPDAYPPLIRFFFDCLRCSIHSKEYGKP